MTMACMSAELVALFGFLAGAVTYVLRLLRPERDFTRLGRFGVLSGAGLMGMGLLAHAFTGGGQAVFGRFANLTFFLCVVTVIGLQVIERRTERPAVGAFITPVLFLLMLFTVFHPTTTIPSVGHAWLLVHIVLALIAYASFGLGFCAAMAYLVDDWWLKHKQVERLPLLPPLNSADNIGHWAAAVGFTVFTLGLVVGVASVIALHKPLDIKMGTAFATWLVYLTYVLGRHLLGWRGKRLQSLLVVGFLLAMLNYMTVRHGKKLFATGETVALLALHR
jgi:ABC-type uncharacterized transport system permease subunit